LQCLFPLYPDISSFFLVAVQIVSAAATTGQEINCQQSHLDRLLQSIIFGGSLSDPTLEREREREREREK
jgi:hypothetical protein